MVVSKELKLGCALSNTFSWMQMTLTYRWCFLNILVSYLHFSDLVWISYEVFKVTVKQSNGKSTRGAKWLGQNWWLLGIRGKTNEWDTTRGINLIIPYKISYQDAQKTSRTFACNFYSWKNIVYTYLFLIMWITLITSGSLNDAFGLNAMICP